MINTYNETRLHKTLKELYALQNEGSKTEVPCGKYIADIMKEDGSIIEIQTGTLSSLAGKIEYFSDEKRHVTVVFPLPVEKFIEKTDECTGKTSRKKSPKKMRLTSVFRELTKLYPFLLSRNFTFIVLETQITEERTVYGTKMQSKNGRRRFMKNWQKTGKRLDSIIGEHVFHGKTSWKKLLPNCFFSTEMEFTSTLFHREIEKKFPGTTKKESDLMLWVYTKMLFFERLEEKKGNSYIYRLL